MVSDLDRLDIERLENLIGNFDWKLVKQEVVDKKIVLTITRDENVVDVKVGLGAS